MTAEATPTKPKRPKWEQEARDQIKTVHRKFGKPLQDLVERDANEGDTRILVTDILTYIFGYDKFEDLTTEYAVRGEFADYGVRIDKQLVAFIEVKRAAQQLNQRHLRQVETYAVKEGVEWVVLTNGQVWQVYHVTNGTGTPVVTTLALEIDLLSETPTREKNESLFYLHKDSFKRGLISELWNKQSATSPEALTQVILSERVLDTIRKEIKRNSGYNIDVEALGQLIKSQVVKPTSV